MGKMRPLTTLFLVATLKLTACVAPSNVYHSASALAPPLQSSVLILPPDVVISMRNAGGNSEPRADWSESVTSQLIGGLEEYFYNRGVEFIPYGASNLSDEHLDIIRQANVIMDAVELSQARGVLPGDREYSLGDDAAALESYGADYALYIVLQANRASGGRQAVAFLAAVGGVAVTTSDSQFRVGLFDLRDGQLKWANFDPAAVADIGDPLDASPERWADAIEHFLTEFPL